MTKMYFYLGLLSFFTIQAAHAYGLECYIADGTNKATCIAPSQTKANGNLRQSPLYRGGSKNVDKTPYFFVTDCHKKITTLQDRDGVNFGGAACVETAASRRLCQAICDVKNPKKDKSITQFE